MEQTRVAAGRVCARSVLLAIARRIAQQLGGTLTCDPTPQGACFTLGLPRAPSPEITVSNSLEVFVGYVRRKTEADDAPRLIHTVRGIGYVLCERL